MARARETGMLPICFALLLDLITIDDINVEDCISTVREYGLDEEEIVGMLL